MLHKLCQINFRWGLITWREIIDNLRLIELWDKAMYVSFSQLEEPISPQMSYQAPHSEEKQQVEVLYISLQDLHKQI